MVAWTLCWRVPKFSLFRSGVIRFWLVRSGWDRKGLPESLRVLMVVVVSGLDGSLPGQWCHSGCFFKKVYLCIAT